MTEIKNLRLLSDAASETMDCLAGGGNMGALIRQTNWSETPLGPVPGWSQPLRTMVGLVLRNGFPLSLWWGPQLVQIYNDPFVPILGAKHPAAVGQLGTACWAEIWPTIGPMIEGPFSGGPAAGSEDLSLLIHRSGFFEECHFRVAYSPVPDETVIGTGIGGVLATVSETSSQVQDDRQLRTLRELGATAIEVKSADEACVSAAAALGLNPADVPFSLFFLLDDLAHPRLAATSGFGSVPADAKALDPSAWPLAACVAGLQSDVLDDLRERFASLPTGSWAQAPGAAIVLPIAAPDQQRPYGVLVAGLSPHRRLDENYRGFFQLAVAQVVTAIRNARAYEEDQKRLEALAYIDRAKIAFFSNVSHEFRTPLALMLGPIEDALGAPGQVLSGEALQMAHRNALRLLKLVNSLLDFSRMEAGRIEASFQATDLARLTADLSSQFRAAMDRAGLRLIVETQPQLAPAFVDREMWEKIVLNLLSNAFKHTFEGEVKVSLSTTGESIVLTVRDTGVGIPADELPRVFERFHRVRGARARSHEGTGIGLAMVRDLVKLHGGKVEARSEPNVGTEIAVSIPRGSAHLPPDRIEAPKVLATTAAGAAAYVNDALSWLPPDSPERAGLAIASSDPRSEEIPARLVLADDNADMREYLRRLLSAHWTVEAVADGQQALEAVRRTRPDLVVSDVMMPNLDGLGLTRALRDDPKTERLPIILLSARTGQEATSEGLASGANDYIVKPFSARELVARVRVQLQIIKSLQHAAELESARLEQEHLRLVAESSSLAKDEFIAVLGHELRNPLSPILLALRLMEMKGEPNFARERAIMGRQVTHLIRLVDDLHDVSRITSGKIRLEKREIKIAAVIAQAIELASPSLEERQHHVVIEVETDSTMYVDPDRVGQVVSNLLFNAAKFTEPGGTITVGARAEGETMVIRVKDTGIGIEPSLLPHLFAAFRQGVQRSDRPQGGLGLGLTIAKSLVTLHGGHIEAHSEGPGRGAEFVVRLPLVAGDDAPNGAPSAPKLPAVTSGLRVLVVDDNRDSADMVADVLRARGHEVVVAYDGPSALQARNTFVPEVALLDIGLPVMDGYELARALRKVDPASPLRIVAISGYAEEGDRVRSKAAGFDEHLVKPVDLDRLLRLFASLQSKREAGRTGSG